MNEVFSKTFRLTHPSDFTRVFETNTGKAQNSSVLVLSLGNSCGHARVGLAVPKRNLKKAVERNHFKRLARESFRKKRGELPNVDIVVLVRKDASLLTNEQFTDGLDKLWQKLIKQYNASS